MTCGGCGRDNRVGARFCAGCGTPLGRCTACGEELPDDSRFCDVCGAAVEDDPGTTSDSGASADLRARKVVTVLFADVAGSTSLQERLDAEATAHLMAQVQQRMARTVEDHGGVVVKTIGDGLMAIFGVPELHEDDALRAVRAGLSLQESFDVPDVHLRVGVNTGEVVVVPGSHDVVGDPVNVAARLEAAAPLGQVLVGPETQRAVRDAVQLEPVAPLLLRGKREPVAAARAVAVVAPSAPSTPFVGRGRELSQLRAMFDGACRDRVAKLVTILGWPGLGKSRLADELLRQLPDSTCAIAVRFVADGGSAFLPVAAALRDEAAGRDDPALAGTISDLAAGAAPASTEQTFWAIRRAVELLASRQPVVLLLDDLHWAESATVNLLEHLAEWTRGVPVLLLATARPELHETAPRLIEPGGPSSLVLVLDALDPSASIALASGYLAPDADMPAAILERVVEASEGNPLFLRELCRLLVDDGVIVQEEGTWRLTVDLEALHLPATVHATIAARIEQLPADEREVLQAAAVIGRHFVRAALVPVLPPAIAASLDRHLEGLHRRALIDPEGAWSGDEPRFRFHHALIRDAAYRRVLKEVRADKHIRYADWLEAHAGESPAEHEATLGQHLELAARLLTEIGLALPAGLTERAAGYLAGAGRRALDGDDLGTATALLTRAAALAPADVAVWRDVCEARFAAGDIAEAAAALAVLEQIARTPEDLAVVHVATARLISGRHPERHHEIPSLTTEAAATFAAAGDHAGVAAAEAVAATALLDLGRVAQAEAALDRSLAAARRAGDRRGANRVLAIAPHAALWGPAPIPRASGRCLDVLRVLRITTWAPSVEATTLRFQAALEALRERFDSARTMLDEARTIFTDLGNRVGLLDTMSFAGYVELLAGQPQVAEPILRRARDGYDALDAKAQGARAATLLARALLELGRPDDARQVADAAIRGSHHRAPVTLLAVQAESLARLGARDEALAVATTAVKSVEGTDALLDHADARLALSRVLRSRGDGRAADDAARLALALYEQKGATVGVRRCAEEAGIDAPTSAPTAATRPPDGVAPNAAAIAWREASTSAMRTVATLGRNLALVARSSGDDDGSLEVVTLDDDGKVDLVGSFPPEALVDAVVRLSRSSEPGTPLATTDAWTVGRRIVDRDWDGFADLFVPEAVLSDHRAHGLEVAGRDEITEWVRQLAALTPDLRVELFDLVHLAASAAIWRCRSTGETTSATRVELQYLVAFGLAPDGRIARLDFFREEREGDAWTAIGATPASPLRAANAAWHLVEEWGRRFHAGDIAGAHALRAPGYRRLLHDLHTEMDGEGARALDEDTARMFEGITFDLVATLEERHLLMRLHLTTTLEHNDRYAVTTLSPDLATIERDTFYVDDLLEAFVGLLERSPSTARFGLSTRRLWRSRQVDELRAALHPDIVVVDGGRSGVGELRGVERVQAWLTSWIAGTVVVDVLGVSRRGALVAVRAEAAAADGADAATGIPIVLTATPDGRIDRIERFESLSADAVGRFRHLAVEVAEPDVLVGERLHVGRVGDARSVELVERDADGGEVARETFPPGALDRAMQRAIERWSAIEPGPLPIARCGIFGFFDAVNQERWSDVRQMYAPDAAHHDLRPASIGTIEGADRIVAWMQSFGADELRIELGGVLAVTPTATLFRMPAAGRAGGGEFTLESYVGVLVDERGSIVRTAQFGLEQHDEAVAWFEDAASGRLDVAPVSAGRTGPTS